jgi:hypothetical protein
MRDLIRHILKEEVLENKDDIIKGINISVKILKQEFLFIKGWVFDDPIEAYGTTIYINLIVNFDEALEYYNLKPNPIFKGHILKRKVPYPFSGMLYDDIFDEPYNEYSKIRDVLLTAYQYLPSDVKMETDFSKRHGILDYKQLNIEGFIFE